MPLISHAIEGHDEERHAFRFSTLNDDQVVVCQISDAALDELAGTESTARMEQFLALRDKINRLPRSFSTKNLSFVAPLFGFFPNTLRLKLTQSAKALPVKAANSLRIVSSVVETRFATRLNLATNRQPFRNCAGFNRPSDLPPSRFSGLPLKPKRDGAFNLEKLSNTWLRNGPIDFTIQPSGSPNLNHTLAPFSGSPC